jgi:hypothetical protein
MSDKLDANEVAELADVSPSTVRSAHKKGWIESDGEKKGKRGFVPAFPSWTPYMLHELMGFSVDDREEVAPELRERYASGDYDIPEALQGSDEDETDDNDTAVLVEEPEPDELDEDAPDFATHAKEALGEFRPPLGDIEAENAPEEDAEDDTSESNVPENEIGQTLAQGGDIQYKIMFTPPGRRGQAKRTPPVQAILTALALHAGNGDHPTLQAARAEIMDWLAAEGLLGG